MVHDRGIVTIFEVYISTGYWK